jgi:thiamine biosynthesis lipoprotein
MGTVCALHLSATAATEAAVAAVAAQAMLEVDRIERKYSRYRPDSVLSAINRVAARGGVVELDEETASLIDYAEVCWRKSDRLFDLTSGLLRRAWDFSSNTPPNAEAIAALLPRIGWHRLAWRRPVLDFPIPGMELDFGGLGKEYAVDRLADLCRDAGIAGGLIDLGGDLFVLGPHPDGAPWRIGLRHPRQADHWLCELAIESGGLATSGDYERCLIVKGRRYAHILDPATGSWAGLGDGVGGPVHGCRQPGHHHHAETGGRPGLAGGAGGAASVGR